MGSEEMKARAEDIDLEDEEVEFEIDGDGEQYISHEDIVEEITLDGDAPMEEDDEDEAKDILPELRQSSSSAAVQNTSFAKFTAHTASVFSISCHPTQPLAISGGEDDLAYIWNLHDASVVVKLTGHTDSVTCTAWSADGEMAATGGMDGKVRVWRRVGKNDWSIWEFLTEVTGPDEVMFLRWHPKGAVLLAGSNDSTLWLWQFPSGSTMQVFAGHSSPVNCGEFTPDGKKIISADQKNTLILWDPRSTTPIFKLTDTDARFNLDGITSLGVNPASTLAVVGGAAGGVRVVNLAKGEIVGALKGHKEGESVEAVAFVDLTGGTGGVNIGPGVAVTGATDGRACIWDLGTMRLRATLEHEDAITTLLTPSSQKTHLLISASADKTLKIWDARSGKLIQTHTGHDGPVLGAALGMDDEVVVSAGDDGICYVFRIEENHRGEMVA